MLRTFTSHALILVVALAVAVGCGDEEGNNGNPNIFSSNSSTVNNMSTSNNMSSSNNMSTSNNMSSSNNMTTGPIDDCIELNPALEGECDVLCQSGCAASQSCTMSQMEVGSPEPEIVWTATCIESGQGGYEAECTADADCQRGFTCMEPPEGGDSMVCLEYCRVEQGIAPQCDPGFECIPFRSEIRIGLCRPEPENCAIFPSDTCGEDVLCYQSLQDGSYECLAPGETERDEECSGPADCESSSRCVDVNGTSLCKLLCDPSDDEPDRSCLDGEFCNTQTDEDGNELSWGACY